MKENNLSKGDRLWIFLMRVGCSSGCHQRADRSFFFGKYQYPVCARCTGVVLGQVLMLLQVLLLGEPNLYLCVGGLVIMFADWYLQHLHVLESTNFRRIVTGTLAGYGLFGMYYFVFLFIKNLIA